jgi:U1 small nuclear ribonucleoprotein A
MRGQAFIVYQNNAQASEALRNLNNAPFFGKAMEVQWARRDSDVTLSLPEQEKIRKTRRRLITKEYFKSRKFKERMSKKMAQRSKELQELGQSNAQVIEQLSNPQTSDSQVQSKQVIVPEGPPAPQKKLNEPHSMLILKNLPDIPTETLKGLFAKFEGFKEMRHIISKKVALVDFDDSSLASVALEGMEKFVFEGGEVININFGKK